MAVSVSMREFASQQALLEHFHSQPSRQILRGAGGERTREFFCIEMVFETETLLVGIYSYGMGIRPAWTIRTAHVFVGFNEEIVIGHPSNPWFSHVALDDLFWEFVDADVPHTCVLCEASVVAVDAAGSIVWQRNTDLVKTFEVQGRVLSIEPQDDPPVRIDLRSGDIIASRSP